MQTRQSCARMRGWKLWQCPLAWLHECRGWYELPPLAKASAPHSSFFKRPVQKITPINQSVMQQTVVVRIACRATIAPPAGSSESAQQCDQITRRGFYCAVHANELLGLEVKTSLLLDGPGEAGLGLFTTRDRNAWTIVDEYLGDVVSTEDFNQRPSPFAVSISQGRVINSTRSTDCFARFTNDARGTAAENNCWLVSDRQFGINWARPPYTNGNGGRVWLMTTRAVHQGEELLVQYGAQYWGSRV